MVHTSKQRPISHQDLGLEKVTLLHSPSACLLVSHGSRDPRPEVEMAYLAKLVAQQLSQKSSMKSKEANDDCVHPSLVEAAVLELDLPLHQQIQQFAERATALGCLQLHVMPIFLLPGVHVLEDIPAEVAIAQQTLGDKITLEISPYLGSHASLRNLWLELVPDSVSPEQGRILLGHGSRRVGGNAPLEAIAAQLAALPAYWSVAPSLTDQVNLLVNQGCIQIEILPYFLFEGGITDAIAQSVQALKQQLPNIQLRWMPPQGATAKLASFVVDTLTRSNASSNVSSNASSNASSNEVLTTVREAAKT